MASFFFVFSTTLSTVSEKCVCLFGQLMVNFG